MKLINTLQGFSVLRVSPDEALPPGGIPLQTVIPIIKEKYKFTIFPNPRPGEIPFVQMAPIGMEFHNGEFSTEDGRKLIVVVVQFFMNGLTVGSASTLDSDEILDDIVRTLDLQAGFKFSQSQQQRSYGSTVVVDFDLTIEDAIPQLKAIQELFVAARQQLPNPPDIISVKRLSFGREARTNDPARAYAGDFVIERRLGAPFSSNRYSSGAPLTTDAHVQLLGKFEDILKGGLPKKPSRSRSK